jgi:hypothetical protein
MKSALGRQAFDGDNLFAGGGAYFGDAGVAGQAIQQHGASAALTFTTTVFTTGKIEMVAQDAEQADIRIYIHGLAFTINVKLGNFRHGAPEKIRRLLRRIDLVWIEVALRDEYFQRMVGYLSSIIGQWPE